MTGAGEPGSGAEEPDSGASQSGSGSDEPRLGAVLGWLALFVVVGALPFYLVWSFLNHALAGRVEAGRGGLALLGLLVLLGLLSLVVRRIGGWEREPR